MALRVLNPQEEHEMDQARERLRLGTTNGPIQCSLRLDQRIPGKGQGYRALHLITPGTLIHAERPLFIVDNVEAHKNISAATTARINDAVQNLPRTGLQHYRTLVNPFPRRIAQPDKEIFLGNNFQMTPTQGGRQTQGIFLRASRFNHSCIPNAWYNWNPHYTNPGRAPPGSLTVYAIRDIKEDEEIVVNYHSDHVYMKASERQRLLQRDYNFTCNCPACQPGGQHAARRLEMDLTAGNAENSQGWGREWNLLKLAELLEQEGLEYPHKATVYGLLADMYVVWMNQHNDRKWEFHSKARQAFLARLEAEILSVGENSQETRDTLLAMAPVL
ncbi:MAG: hypothetical protein L6R38_000910 [Xanthoria sp. 2 TBL-2021]|nr:MAG: hypothetical protein L6R38_000910 [Xanthoria sp. 2 TBL-2021]